MAQTQRKKIYCINHPKKTARKCYECGTPVCKECEILFLGKPYCSKKCILKALWKALQPQFLKTIPAKWLQNSSARLTVAFSAFVIMLFIVLLMAALNMRTQYIQHQLDEKVREAGIIVDEEQEFTLKELPDAMVTSSTIDISGQAADSLIISLKVNGHMQAVLLPTDGQFTFQDIELKTGSNNLQVIALDGAGNSKILHTLTTTYGAPRLSWLARNITRGNPDRKQIALTFDGGSGNGAVHDVLSILKTKNITSTFFLTGRFIQRYSKDVLRMLAAGHEIGNHTWSHPHFTTFEDNFRHDTHINIDRTKIQRELVRTSEKFKQVTNEEMTKYWRAPFGEHNQQIREWAAELGYQQIGWTLGRNESMDTMDWVADTTATTYYTADEILDRLLQFGQDTESRANGGIILMHLHSERKSEQAVTILPAYIDSMRARGYEFVPVSTLLKP